MHLVKSLVTALSWFYNCLIEMGEAIVVRGEGECARSDVAFPIPRLSGDGYLSR